MKKLYEESDIQELAIAIREKTKKTEKMKVAAMAAEVRGIESGIDTSNATALPEHILKDKIAYGANGEMTGTIETYNGNYECSGESTGGGTGGGGINAEFYTVTWETTDDVEISIGYIGLDENNNLTKMSSDGKSGSFECIEGFYIAITTSTSVDSWTGETEYHSINGVMNSNGNYIESYAINSETRLVRIASSVHLTFECSAGGGGW